MHPAALVPVLTLLFAGASPGAERARTPGPRAEMESLRASLEAAVGRAARPMTGSSRAAAYHLRGYGFMVVLSPRVLPAARTAVDQVTSRALAQAMRSLEESLKRVRSPEARERIRQSLRALRETRTHLAHEVEHPVRAIVRMEVPGVQIADEPDLEELERHMRSELAAQAQALHDAEREIHEQHSRALQENAEDFRREADRARVRAEREVRVRLRPSTPPPARTPPVPTAPPAAPGSPATLEAPLPPEPPLAPQLPEVPPPPPWRFWVDTEEPPDPRSVEGVVSEVRQALLAGLQAYRGPLRALRPEESISVAVAFVPRRGGHRSAARTLIAHLRKKDLEDRRAGRLSVAGFAQRVDFEEY